MFLLELSKQNFPFVFKGGTSLSKVYNLIDRFSEDIDLSVNRKLTESEKKTSKQIIINVASQLGLTLENPERIKSRYEYNMYIFTYNSLFSEVPMQIIIETSYYQAVYPVEEREVTSYVGHFCKERDITLPIEFAALSFMMNVQSLERTFIDKVFAICDYRIQNMRDRDSRHLYDICKLINNVEFNNNFDELVDVVRDDRMLSKNNPSANLNYNIPQMLQQIIDSRFFESDYKNVTHKLLYEDMDYDYAVDNGIALLAKSDVFIYKK